VTRVSTPHAPWALVGECVVGVVRRRKLASTLPAGIHRLPGPCVVTAVRYSDSPVGPYLELAVGEPARLGARPGLCVTTMVVTTAEARVGGRLNWGFPKEVGALRWRSHGDEREVVWEDRDIVVRGRPWGPAPPLLVPMRALQRRGDGPVVVPGRLRGRAQLARVELEVPDGDALVVDHQHAKFLIHVAVEQRADPLHLVAERPMDEADVLQTGTPRRCSVLASALGLRPVTVERDVVDALVLGDLQCIVAHRGAATLASQRFSEYERSNEGDSSRARRGCHRRRGGRCTRA